jgi:PHD/YefM family antitoxin component YafN of YafNO toxin-antitoxin module
MLSTTVQSFAKQMNELFAKIEDAREPLIIERAEGNMVVIPQSDFDNIMLFFRNKRKEKEEYGQLRDAFFQSSRQAMASKIEKYLD